jgi:excisionase family DNA binding protein
MLAAAEIQLVQDTVRELQARGEAARARAVAAALDLALATTDASPAEPRRFLTAGQAASVLGVSATTVRRWVAAGELGGALHQARRVLIPPEVVQHKLDQLLQLAEPEPVHPASILAEQKLDAQTLQSELPQARTARLAELHEQFEATGALTPNELAELDSLEREIASAAAQALRTRITRGRAGSR